ncbi:MAG: hypothetical protein ACLR0U_01540 [Enterocloster clostridioformis]
MAQIKAEEQALIAGMRAVPKAERHRLREIPEDGAHTGNGTCVWRPNVWSLPGMRWNI